MRKVRVYTADKKPKNSPTRSRGWDPDDYPPRCGNCGGNHPAAFAGCGMDWDEFVPSDTDEDTDDLPF